MICNVDLHNELIQMEYIDYPFCDQQLQKPSVKHISCFKKTRRGK